MGRTLSSHDRSSSSRSTNTSTFHSIGSNPLEPISAIMNKRFISTGPIPERKDEKGKEMKLTLEPEPTYRERCRNEWRVLEYRPIHSHLIRLCSGSAQTRDERENKGLRELTWSNWVTRPSRCVTVHIVSDIERESSAIHSITTKEEGSAVMLAEVKMSLEEDSKFAVVRFSLTSNAIRITVRISSDLFSSSSADYDNIDTSREARKQWTC